MDFDFDYIDFYQSFMPYEAERDEYCACLSRDVKYNINESRLSEKQKEAFYNELNLIHQIYKLIEKEYKNKENDFQDTFNESYSGVCDIVYESYKFLADKEKVTNDDFNFSFEGVLGSNYKDFLNLLGDDFLKEYREIMNDVIKIDRSK